MTHFTLKFFAKLREQTGVDEMSIPVDDVSCLSDLKLYLMNQKPEWAVFLQANLLQAVNQSMVTGDVSLKPGDEVALFPPVTGG